MLSFLLYPYSSSSFFLMLLFFTGVFNVYIFQRKFHSHLRNNQVHIYVYAQKINQILSQLFNGRNCLVVTTIKSIFLILCTDIWSILQVLCTVQAKHLLFSCTQASLVHKTSLKVFFVSHQRVLCFSTKLV